MKIKKKLLNNLILNYLFESQGEKKDIENLDAQHIDRYGKPLSKQQRAYNESEPTIYLDDIKNIPNDSVDTQDYPTYEEFMSLSSLVRTNTRNLNQVYQKMAQDKYDIKRLLKHAGLPEDPIFNNK